MKAWLTFNLPGNSRRPRMSRRMVTAFVREFFRRFGYVPLEIDMDEYQASVQYEFTSEEWKWVQEHCSDLIELDPEITE